MIDVHKIILTGVTLALTLCLANSPVLAQDLSSGSKEPLEITADGTLEWLRGQQQLVATKNALARQGDSSVAGEKLTAQYREKTAGSGIDIWKVHAQNNVVLKSRDSTVYGQDAVYNLDKGLATVTGDNLKMISPDQTVTARDRFEYWVADGRVNAIGNARVVRPKPTGGTDTLQADKVSAVLKRNAAGEQVLHSLEAIGNVVIVTPSETITGAYGIYRAGSNIAELTGGVKIRRGPNTLEGERAEVDLNTDISTIFGAADAKTPEDGGRVRAIFYPDSEELQSTPEPE